MKKSCVFPLFAVIVIAFLLIRSLTIVPTGYTGVKTSFGQIQETTIQSGKLNFTIPFVQSIHTNSPLVAYTKLSPNHSGQRTHSIDRITPHCVVGQLSAESICGCFINTSRQASCNYGIGKDGRISLCVEEKNRSWCSSSRENDQRAITIECASDNFHPYA